MSTIKVDTIATRTGSGNITVSNNAVLSGDLTVDTSTLKVDAANNRVGIGTASTSTNLDITASGGQVTVDASGHITSKQSLDAATAGGRIIGASNRGTVSQIDLAQTTSSADGGYIRFLTCDSGSTNPTERMRLLSGGGLTFNGDTATANALDDYEEGSWSPVWSAGVTSPGYLVQQGRYTKIGNRVTLSCYLRSNSGTANGSHVYLGGLPFTATNSITAADGGYNTYLGGFYTATNGAQWLAINNSTVVALYRQTDGAALGGTSSGVSVHADVRIVISYQTD